jgi:succinate-semialdehyde dehydrogenase/glutarate-semialdehyde dehydrogenase
MTYPNTQLFINGQWQDAASGKTWRSSTRPPARKSAAWPMPASPTWTRRWPLRKKASRPGATCPPSSATRSCAAPPSLMRERAGAIGALLTQEQGKPLVEAKGEAMAAADIIEWFADEGLRVYGRIVPSRFNLATRQMVLKDPVGPVAAFTPWNFPINQVVRKIGRGAGHAAAR